jgi:hypothetical protein
MEAHALHEPLSLRLARVLEGNPVRPTLNGLLERTEGRGHFLVIILLCLPFVVPVSIPGASTLIGLVVGLLSLRLAFGQPPRLPRFLGERSLPRGLEQKLLKVSVKFLRLLERLVRPRQTRWLAWPSARCVNALLLVFLAALLALPIPPVVLFTNTLPALAIILIAASMMEEDGVTIFIGYLLSLVAVIYFVLVGGAIEAGVSRLLRWFQEWGAA